MRVRKLLDKSATLLLPFVVVSFSLAVSCDTSKYKTSNHTLPGNTAVLSLLPEPIWVLDVESLSQMAPTGLIVANASKRLFPQNGVSGSRVESTTMKCKVRWLVGGTIDELRARSQNLARYEQDLILPDEAIGSDGELVFVLHENNTWSCMILIRDNDYNWDNERKQIAEHLKQTKIRFDNANISKE